MKPWWKQLKYVALAILSAVLVVLGIVLRGLFSSKQSGDPKIPSVPEKMKARVAQAEEEALVAKVESKTKADGQKKQLAEVMTEPDGAVRRRRLATLLKTL